MTLSKMTLWRQAHPGKYKEYYATYYSKNRKDLLARNKKWREENKDKYNAGQRSWRKRNKPSVDAYHAKRRIDQRKKLLDSIGAECIICFFKEENGNKLHFHEIHGDIHPYNKGSYILKHQKDFVALCSKCHHIIHIISRCNGNLNKLVELCNLAKDGNTSKL
jgi:hypothetical protein